MQINLGITQLYAMFVYNKLYESRVKSYIMKIVCEDFKQIVVVVAKENKKRTMFYVRHCAPEILLFGHRSRNECTLRFYSASGIRVSVIYDIAAAGCKRTP